MEVVHEKKGAPRRTDDGDAPPASPVAPMHAQGHTILIPKVARFVVCVRARCVFALCVAVRSLRARVVGAVLGVSMPGAAQSLQRLAFFAAA